MKPRLTDSASEPAIAVVIVARDAGGYLDEVAESLARLTLRPRRVIVADNGSSDGAVDALALRQPEVEVLRSGAQPRLRRREQRGSPRG